MVEPNGSGNGVWIVTRIKDFAAELLREHGYVVVSNDGDPQHLLFESDQSIGILIAYADVDAVLNDWVADTQTLLSANQLGFRRSLEKAWNAYLVFLVEASASALAQARLDSIEENLIGTRKIARAGLKSKEEVSRALLPLLPLQNPPNLQPVDMKAEIRIRTTQLPTTLIDAFLADRDAITIMQILEE
jgi:hypothetical protein